MAGTETGFEGVWRLKTGVGRRKYCFPEGRGIDGLNVVEGEKSRKGSSVCEDSEGGEKDWRFLRWGGGVSLSPMSPRRLIALISNTPQLCLVRMHSSLLISDFHRIEQCRRNRLLLPRPRTLLLLLLALGCELWFGKREQPWGVCRPYNERRGC